VFGFCHSGLQIAAMRARFGGRHVYLARDPREQFRSYAPASNDFFCAATCVQLLSSDRLRGAAVELVPGLRRYANPLLRAVVGGAPYRVTMKLARAIRGTLDIEPLYLLFYLSWLASTEAGRSCDMRITLRELHADREQRASFERAFAVRLDGLRGEETESETPALPYPELEERARLAFIRAS
jgi:hypothetical protein